MVTSIGEMNNLFETLILFGCFNIIILQCRKRETVASWWGVAKRMGFNSFATHLPDLPSKSRAVLGEIAEFPEKKLWVLGGLCG